MRLLAQSWLSTPRDGEGLTISGPYRHWVHTHRFIEERGGTRMVDEIDFQVPFQWLAGRRVARHLERIFRYRHEALLGLFHEPKPWPTAQVTIT